jgi:branched-chain amino acid transport system substrate-binding protein
MRRGSRITVIIAAALGGLLAAGVPRAGAAAKEVVIGVQCDRTGATNTIGPFFCAGVHDYIHLVNKKGGVEGYQIRGFEIDMKYEVPLAVEAYQRQKQEGAVSIMLYGTPQTYALTPKLTEDKIPGTSPGFGRADASDGRLPYIFPIAATYWSQATASVKYIMDQVKGHRPLKIAFLHYDNPAGKEPIPVLEKLAKKENFELRTFAVPPPGIEMSAQVLDIAQRYRADWVITHLFGRSPSVSIKELKRVGFKMDHVVGFVWGAAESDLDAAGWATGEGYLGLQFAGAGTDFPVHKEIIEMYKAEGKEPPKEMAKSVYYNRGILHAAIHVEAIRNAAKMGGPLTGEKVRAGMQQIKGLTLGGLVPPMEITAMDHEGGGWVKMYQVKGGKWVAVTDWYKAYPEVIAEELRAAK